MLPQSAVYHSMADPILHVRVGRLFRAGTFVTTPAERVLYDESTMANPTHRLVCFDLGGVIIRICRTWAEGCRAAGLDVRRPELWRQTHIARRRIIIDYQTGRIDGLTFASRASALVERRKEYIEAATCLALSHSRILFRHLLPNCLPPLIVVATVQTASAIALEATLSFLGVGLPQTEPSLGLLIANGFEYMLSGKYWISFFPGVALLITIVSINLVGDQLREVLNPRLER